MKITTANKIAKKLCCQYGIINPPEIIPLKYSRTGKSVILGYYNNEENKVELNKHALCLWDSKQIRELIQHELIHALSYQEFGIGGHGKHFRELAKRLHIGEDIARAVKRREE